MSDVALISGILCIVMAVIVFVLADGLRRWLQRHLLYGHGAGDVGQHAALAVCA